MLDINLIREDPEVVRAGMRKRGMDPSLVDEAIRLDSGWRDLLQEVESLKAERNTVSKEIGKMKDKEQREAKIADELGADGITRGDKYWLQKYRARSLSHKYTGLIQIFYTV